MKKYKMALARELRSMAFGTIENKYLYLKESKDGEYVKAEEAERVIRELLVILKEAIEMLGLASAGAENGRTLFVGAHAALLRQLEAINERIN